LCQQLNISQLRRISAIERELKEAEREKELQKAGESWEKKKEKLVRRKSFEIEAIEKELELRKAVEMRRVSEECDRELREKRAALQRENEARLAALRDELAAVEQRAVSIPR
jgi:hypothetical protein